MLNITFNEILYIINILLFIPFLFYVIYLLIFAVASLKTNQMQFPIAKRPYRFAVIIIIDGAEKEFTDNLQSFINQDYPKSKYDIIVAYNKRYSDIIEPVRDQNLIFIQCPDAMELKSNIINYAMEKISGIYEDSYDVAIIMGINEKVKSNFIRKINRVFYSGGMTIQTHRLPSNSNNPFSFIASLSEEINNSIFRRGHVQLGFSTSLMETGNAFDFKWLMKNIKKIHSRKISKGLELQLLKENQFVEYLENIHTIIKAPDNLEEYKRVKEGWNSNNDKYLKYKFTNFFKSLAHGNYDMCDKIIQWTMPSRILLPLYILIIGIITFFIDYTWSIKWFTLIFILMLAYYISIPKRFINTNMAKALITIPIIITNRLKSRLSKKKTENEDSY